MHASSLMVVIIFEADQEDGEKRKKIRQQLKKSEQVDNIDMEFRKAKIKKENSKAR